MRLSRYTEDSPQVVNATNFKAEMSTAPCLDLDPDPGPSRTSYVPRKVAHDGKVG